MSLKKQLILAFLMIWALGSPPHAAATDIWAKGQWERDGAVNIFNSVTVRKDGSIDIIEKFEGLEGDFAHSLSRPHASNALLRGVPSMEVTGATVDGKPAKVHVGRNSKGVPLSVKIAAPGPGRHTYILRLKTADRILFANRDYEEFSWETGSAFGQSRLARVSCSITLPEGAALKGQSAWLGQKGAESRKVFFWKGKSGNALYRGEEYMTPGEAFAVTVRWSKGAVTPPGIWDAGREGKNGACDIHNVVTVQKDGTIFIDAHYKGYEGTFYHNLRRLYSSTSRFAGSAPIEFISATVDGKPASATFSTIGGEPVTVVIVPPSEGPHDYVLRLKTTDCVLFDNSAYDAFTWDVGGAHPRARVSCVIRLPEGAAVLGQEARLGHETAGHKQVTIWQDKPGEVHYRGEAYMENSESFAVSVRFSKGVVTPAETAVRTAKMELWAWILFAVILAFCVAMWWFFGKDPRPKVAVPRFYPPVDGDGNILSPAAVAYVRDSARLKSRGFVGLLLNLAVQKALSISGSGTKKDPYILSPGKKTGPEAPEGNAAASDAQQAGEGSSSRWNAKIRRGKGFDAAERVVLQHLFSSGAQHVFGRQSSWSMAKARGAAYLQLSQSLRGAWRLRAGVVLAMHCIVYAVITTFLGLSAAAVSGDWAVVCAIVTVGALMAWLYTATFRKVHRFLIEWQEMGWFTMACFIVLCLLVPLILLYDWIVIPSKDMADFAGRDFMAAWQWLRILLVFLLPVLLYRRTRSLDAVFVGPLKFLGFLLGFVFILGMLWAMNFPGTSSLALLLALVSPTVFLPIMKQPSPDALQLMADIEGFAMYIGTAETSRLNLLNAPGRTPEEFERVMPYAIALGLENAWGAKFADIAAELHFRGSLGTLDEFQHRLDGI